MTYDGYFATDQVDETADVTEMSGDATIGNQAAGNRAGVFFGTPTRSLVTLWFLAVLLYAAIGSFFRKQRS